MVGAVSSTSARLLRPCVGEETTNETFLSAECADPIVGSTLQALGTVSVQFPVRLVTVFVSAALANRHRTRTQHGTMSFFMGRHFPPGCGKRQAWACQTTDLV